MLKGLLSRAKNKVTGLRPASADAMPAASRARAKALLMGL